MQTSHAVIRHDWTHEEISDLYALPFADLIFKAHLIHRQHFDPNAVQVSTILNFKTGACPENCGYCGQSAHFDTGVGRQPALTVAEVVAAAQKAKESGASRFCLAAAWRGPKPRDLQLTIEMIKQVKALGLEACVTLGMLSEGQAEQLKAAGLDFYNHNLDTSPEHYHKIVSTRTYQDRLDTLQRVREAGLKVCCGGILGMGETRQDRISLLIQLANLPEHPQSVPINQLVLIPGTPLAESETVDSIEFVRTVAIARIMMPTSMLRLSGGRYAMSLEMHSLCFLAGANSIHYGEKLLVTPNADMQADQTMFQKLGLKPLVPQETVAC